MDDRIIIVRNLVKIYKNGVKANDNISFEVRRGEIFSVLGPNGAGKTTLIKQLAGLLKPTSGSIIVAGVDVVKEPDAVKGHVSLCPQESAVIGHLTVFEHLYYFGRLKGLSSSEAKEEVRALLERFDLRSYANKYVGSLSKGLQRRIIVAQAFLGTSEIVFLDEPTTHLDPLGRRYVWSIIRDYRKEGITILLTTHYMDEAERLSDRVMFLNKGRIVTIGSIETVKRLIGNYVKIRLNRFYEDILRKKLIKLISTYNIFKYSDSFIDIVLPRDNDLLRELLNSLIDIGIEFELRAPSLEDVFLEVVRNEGQKVTE